MTLTIDAVFDGDVFRPQARIDLPANTRYMITIDDNTGAAQKPMSEPARVPVTSLDDSESLSWRIYNDKLRATLEPQHNGELVAIHIESGDFEIARSSPQAWKALRKRQPTGQIDVIDIGPVAVDNSLALRDHLSEWAAQVHQPAAPTLRLAVNRQDAPPPDPNDPFVKAYAHLLPDE
ncbi:MAG: hypothetical protein ACLQVD_02995 [Capsulimonadaceae bacterium]